MAPHFDTDPGSPHVLDQLTAYFTTALPVVEEVAVETHLLHCPDCRAEYDELGLAALLLAGLPGGVPEDGFDESGSSPA